MHHEIKSQITYTAKDTLGRDVFGFKTPRAAHEYMISTQLRMLLEHDNWQRDVGRLQNLINSYVEQYKEKV